MKKKFTKTKIQRKINIYYSNLTKQNLEQIKEKYHVSFSTIAEKLYFITINEYLKNNIDLESISKTYYTDIKKLNKTSIKPKIEENLTDNAKNAIIITNILFNHVNNYKNTNLKQEIITKIKNRLNTELQKQKEAYWNLNSIIRTTKRAYRILGINQQ